MKFFAIATATAIGASFIAPNPAEARDGWILVGESKSGSFYAKLDKRTGQYAHLSVNDTIDNEDTKMVINCKSWEYTIENSAGWKPIMPSSVSEGHAQIFC